MEIPELKFIRDDGENTLTTDKFEILQYKNIYFILWDSFNNGNKDYLLINDIIITDSILEIPCKYTYNNKIYNLTGFTKNYLFSLDENKNLIPNIDNKVELINFINFTRKTIDIHPYNILLINKKFNKLNTVVINNKYIIKKNNNKWTFQN